MCVPVHVRSVSGGGEVIQNKSDGRGEEEEEDLGGREFTIWQEQWNYSMVTHTHTHTHTERERERERERSFVDKRER